MVNKILYCPRQCSSRVSPWSPFFLPLIFFSKIRLFGLPHLQQIYIHHISSLPDCILITFDIDVVIYKYSDYILYGQKMPMCCRVLTITPVCDHFNVWPLTCFWLICCCGNDIQFSGEENFSWLQLRSISKSKNWTEVHRLGEQPNTPQTPPIFTVVQGQTAC